MFFRSWLALLVALFFLSPAQAKLFKNAYISFELPGSWNCELEQTEWVCTSKYNRRAKEAIIILTAKEKGPNDSLAAYKNHLKEPRTLPSRKGKSQKSKVIHVKERQVDGWKWVDGMHLGSEVSSYYTRYLATVKNRLGILVTFSAHKKHYTKYSSDFINAIKSLKVVAGKNILSKRPNVQNQQGGGGTIGSPIGGILGDGMDSSDYPEEDSSGLGGISDKMIALILIILALGIYIVIKSGNRRKKSSQRHKGK